MTTNGDQKSYELLRDLADTIKKIIDDGLSNGILKSEQEVYLRWKTKDFKYDDNGPSNSGSEGEYLVKDSWFRASVSISEELKKLSKYEACLEHLKNRFGDRISNHHLDRYGSMIISGYLHDKRFGDDAVTSLIERLLKGLKGEPLIYGAKVELQGIVLRPDKVNVAHGIILRKTTKEDVEKEYPYYSIAMTPRSPFYTTSSAILQIEFLGSKGNEIQKQVEEAIALLRLFRAGGVNYTSYHMHTDSLVDIAAGGTLSSHDITPPQEKYIITEEDVEPLKRFWENLHASLPSSLFWFGQGKEDHVTIAYKRYSDALLQNGVIERRIANAIMGLEGLLLKPGEVQELVYRLSNRVAKLLANLKHHPLETKKIIMDAYRVRNLFAHGGQLSYNERKKLENKYKDVKNLLLHVLDYLRVCIVAYITLNMEKEAFIDLIDASFLDRKSEEQLTGVLNNARYVFGLN